MSCKNNVPYGTGPSRDEIGALEAKINYTPTKVPDSVITRAIPILQFFKGKTPAEFGLAVAGVWGCESGIDSTRYNKGEQSNGGRVNGVTTSTNTFTYKGTKYEKTEETMRKFGYGKGLAQWTWDRPLKFRDWYNGGGVPTPSLPTMDENASAITATSVSTQTAFAWVEMQERSGEFMSTVNNITHADHKTETEKYKENIKKCVDAVTRGFENGSNAKFANVSDMNRYSGDYWGVDFKKRYEYAIGIYEKIKDNPDYQQYL